MLEESVIRTGVTLGSALQGSLESNLLWLGCLPRHRMRQFPQPPLPPSSAVIRTCLLHSAAILFPLADLAVSIVGIFRSTDGGDQKTPLAPRSWGEPSSPAVNSQNPMPPRAKSHQGGGGGHCPRLHPLKWDSKVPCLSSSPRPSRLSREGKGQSAACLGGGGRYLPWENISFWFSSFSPQRPRAVLEHITWSEA